MLLVWCCTFILIAPLQGRRFFKASPLPKYPEALQWPINALDISATSKEEIYGQPWERSGLFQGDIVVASPGEMKNTLLSPSKKWNLPIPVYINGSDFGKTERAIIEKALTEIEEKTCMRFRQYRAGDSSYVVVRGHDKGCWSMVGRQEGGQMLHLQRPQCVQHGIVIHEFLHALGLHHQQCSPDRDEFVKIHWKNIRQGTEHNFIKYSESTVTTFNLTYDYSSLMHYSDKAFSSNGKSTITPLKPDVSIGQRKGMSKLDATKVNYLYDCHNDVGDDSASDDSLDFSIEDVDDLFW